MDNKLIIKGWLELVGQRIGDYIVYSTWIVITHTHEVYDSTRLFDTINSKQLIWSSDLNDETDTWLRELEELNDLNYNIYYLAEFDGGDKQYVILITKNAKIKLFESELAGTDIINPIGVSLLTFDVSDIIHYNDNPYRIYTRERICIDDLKRRDYLLQTSLPSKHIPVSNFHGKPLS